MNYQARVAAWFASRILAEADVAPLWGLPPEHLPTILACESGEAVDDLVVTTSESGFGYVQAKRGLQVGSNPDSPLAKTLDQFVRQFLRGAPEAGQPPDGKRRPLDAQRDRLVIATESRSSGLLRNELPAVLKRIRDSRVTDLLSYCRIDSEREVLQKLLRHLRRSWEQHSGSAPTDLALRELLCLVRVHILDFDVRQENDREAQDLLQRAVLDEPGQTGRAWGVLEAAGDDLIQSRSQIDRMGLQARLLQAGVALKAPRSYGKRISQLRQTSLITCAWLDRFAGIQVAGKTICLPRTASSVIEDAVQSGSLIIVGEPGAGKSRELRLLHDTLQEKRHDVLIFRAEQLADVEANCLRPTFAWDLPDTLANWPGAQTAFLLIDALDAARGGASSQHIRELVGRVQDVAPRWNVVVTIRDYDLQRGSGWKELFSGEHLGDLGRFQDPRFSNIRHVRVPVLDDEELLAASALAPALSELVRPASPALRGLLRVPFNLGLAASLLDSGVAVTALSMIQAQIELLERYWQQRVTRDDDHGDARDGILERVAEKMVATRKLVAPRSVVSHDSGASAALRSILSEQVLREYQAGPQSRPEPAQLEFSHHILFDYAVSRLFRGAASALVERLQQDPELAIILRPSIVFHFEYVWRRDGNSKVAFWDLLLSTFQTPGITPLGRTIGPGVAQGLINHPEDIEPLVEAIRSCAAGRREAASLVAHHLINALFAWDEEDERPWVGEKAPPWCYLAAVCAAASPKANFGMLHEFFTRLNGHVERMTEDQRSDAGTAARTLLEYAFVRIPRHPNLVRIGIESVCRTSKSEPGSSAALLHTCLGSERVKEYGCEELAEIAHEIPHLLPELRSFVEDLYPALFRMEDDSDALAGGGGSALLSISFSRRDICRMARRALVEHYPTFLRSAPVEARRALTRVAEAYVGERDERHRVEVEEILEFLAATAGPDVETGSEEQEADPTAEFSFAFRGCSSRIRSDGSALWATRQSYPTDDISSLCAVFSRYLDGLSGDPHRTAELESLLDQVAQENRLAFLWRLLLRCGVKYPNTLGIELRELLWATPILADFDTSGPAGDLLSVLYPRLPPGEQEQVEKAIASLPDWMGGSHRASHWKEQFLRRLPQHRSPADDTHQEFCDVPGGGATAPDEEDLNEIPPVDIRDADERELLRISGVPVDEPQNLNLQVLASPLSIFVRDYWNSEFGLEEIDMVTPRLVALRDALETAAVDCVHPQQQQRAWATIATTSTLLARCAELSDQQEQLALIRRLLLEASHQAPSPDPEPKDEDAERVWHRDAVRADAAPGILALSERLPGDQELLSAASRLLRDPIPRVRYSAMRVITELYPANVDLMWEVLGAVAVEEDSAGLVQSRVLDLLADLAPYGPDRVFSHATQIWERFSKEPGAKDVRVGCASVFFKLYVYQNHASSEEVVLRITSNSFAFRTEARTFVAQIRRELTWGPVVPSNPEDEAIRRRAWSLLERIATNASQLLDEHIHSPVSKDESAEVAKQSANLLGNIASELHCAAERAAALDRAPLDKNSTSPYNTTAYRQRFLSDSEPVLDVLQKAAALGHTPAAHDVVQAYEHLFEVDPAGILLRLRDVLQAAAHGGYQYERSGADHAVGLVERLVADQQNILREKPECLRALREILDLFVDAGWGRAVRLAYRLADIYR